MSSIEKNTGAAQAVAGPLCDTYQCKICATIYTLKVKNKLCDQCAIENPHEPLEEDIGKHQAWWDNRVKLPKSWKMTTHGNETQEDKEVEKAFEEKYNC